MFYDTYGKEFFGVIWIPITDDRISVLQRRRALF